MSFDLNQEVWDHADPENLEGRVLPGKYHLLIEGVDDSDNDYVEVSYQVLAGDPQGQEGQTGSERLYCSPKALKRILMFIIAAKLATQDQLVEWKRAGKNVQVDLHQAEGRQICAELVKSDKGYVNWSFSGIWAVDDPAAKSIPKNNGMLATAGTGNGDPLDGVDF